MKIHSGSPYCGRRLVLLNLWFLGLLLATSGRGEAPKVTLARTPNGGIQPQAAVDAKDGGSLLPAVARAFLTANDLL